LAGPAIGWKSAVRSETAWPAAAGLLIYY